MSARNKYLLNGKECEYLNSWLLRYGKIKVRKHQHTPEVILNSYVNDLCTFNKHYPTNSDTHRLEFIKLYIDYVLNVEPRYKALIKLYGMKGWQVGQLLGYKTALTWHKSYKRYTYIRAIVTMIDKHEALLTRMNNPNG